LYRAADIFTDNMPTTTDIGVDYKCSSIYFTKEAARERFA